MRSQVNTQTKRKGSVAGQGVALVLVFRQPLLFILLRETNQKANANVGSFISLMVIYLFDNQL